MTPNSKMAARPESARTRPTAADLEAARGKCIPDLITRNLSILFCGINPGLYSAAVGHHFARPGNRFWSTLYRSRITDRLLRPEESSTLLKYGCGITDLVARSSAAAAELKPEELVLGGRLLIAKVKRHTPRCLAILGLGAYRKAFSQPTAVFGKQAAGVGLTTIWILPNPSGLNAQYPPARLAEEFSRLRIYLSDGGS